MSGQRGQAIVAVLVIMTLVFLVTGAVAVGTSTLLTRLRGPASAVDQDLSVQSAAAAAAGIALDSQGCGGKTAPNQGQGTVTLPASGETRAASVPVSCAMVDHALDQVSRAYVKAGVCTTTDISSQLSGKTDWWILFAARFGPKWLAYVAQRSTSCQTSASHLPSGTPCSAFSTPSTGSASPVIVLEMRCSLTSSITDPMLFVSGARSDFPVYAVPHDSVTTNPTNRYYLATAGTGLPHPDYEQVLLFQPASSSSVPHPSPELRFEGVQP